MPPPAGEPRPGPTPIDQIETDAIMAAFRQAARGRGWLERDELLKDVSLVLGYQRLGPKIEESLRGHLRAAIRRRIIETDGPSLVRAGTATMSDYEPRRASGGFRSVMRKGTHYDREDVIHALARHLGFVRVTDTIREPIKSAITGDPAWDSRVRGKCDLERNEGRVNYDWKLNGKQPSSPSRRCSCTIPFSKSFHYCIRIWNMQLSWGLL